MFLDRGYNCSLNNTIIYFMITSKKELKLYILQDRIMNKYNRTGVKGKILDLIAPNIIIKFLTMLRYAEYYSNIGSMRKYLYAIRLRSLSQRLGFYIPINTCGPGLSLPHYGTIIINKNACIGKNCRIHACVNIGASAGEQTCPRIGDNVYIGPSAVIFGDIRIANNVTIGANATVNRSCDEEYVVLAGSPAKVVKTESRNWIEFNKLK